MKSICLKLISISMIGLLLSGCDMSNPTPKAAKMPTVRIMHRKHATVWEHMRADFSIKTLESNPRVQKFIQQYTRHGGADLSKLTENARPYLYYVVTELEKRELPLELALIPLLESEFRPQATSKAGASGLWQLAAGTARLYGVQQDGWYDGRRDVETATEVALDHIEYLYAEFDGDWPLALAAYNCGDARVRQAIRRNKNLGKPTDYWSLELPKETKLYVPKFLGLVHVVKNSKSLGITLDDIPDQPYFVAVAVQKQISLSQAASFADLDVKEVQRLNAAYKQKVTHPNGPRHLILPIKNVDTFNVNYHKSIKVKPTVSGKSNKKA